MARLSLTASELSDLMKSLRAAYHLGEPHVKRLPRGVIHLDALEPVAVKDQDIPLLAARMQCIAGAVVYTLFHNQSEVKEACALIASWMKGHKPVRILGAGRALLAGAMPGNRLAHAGAQVSFMGGMVPLPNSIVGGGIIACSASGKTVPVIQAMRIAKRHNKRIKIIGISGHRASKFRALCDIFIGLHIPKGQKNPLSALADTEEYMIAEILDGLIVLAGKSAGFKDESWRRGHEDILSGPYAPRSQRRAR
jgi:D-arabinose 5-phosphate isomerase GutQ